MSRELFEKELKSLHNDLLRLGSTVESAVQQSIQALKDQDLDLARMIIENDKHIDEMELKIEEKCLRIIAEQKPLRSDLRTIGAILKTLNDLERMGDYATNIADRTCWIGHTPHLKPLVDIPRMGELAEDMMRKSLEAFVSRNTELAYQVYESDKSVDQLYTDLFQELVDFITKETDAKNSDQAIQLLFVARYLERIADHATNICENVIYMVTGERIKNKQTKGLRSYNK